MEKERSGIAITLALLLGIFLQVGFYFLDVKDTPNKATVEFVKSYVRFDKSMEDRLCSESSVDEEEVNLVDQYIYEAANHATEMGYSLFYMKDCLYDLRTFTLSREKDSARIKIVAERKSGLRNFFGDTSEHVDAEFDLVKEDGKWKVCGDAFSALL